jgi:hypothetical protein
MRDALQQFSSFISTAAQRGVAQAARGPAAISQWCRGEGE